MQAVTFDFYDALLGVGTQWMQLRRRSTLAKAALIGGTFVVLFLIGLVANLSVSD